MPWNFWNLVELRGVFKRKFCRETSLNPNQFSYTQMVWHMHKGEANEDFQHSPPGNIQF